MDNSVSQNQEYVDLYKQQRSELWKNRVHKFFIAAWPYFYRFLNEFLLIMMKVIRGSIQIVKDQLMNR